MSIISIQNLSKTYDYYKKQAGLFASVKGLFFREKLYARAVDNISFNINEGELVGFLGPNGAGKTTTIKILAGILYPTAGQAKVLGYNPWQRKKDFQKQFGIVFGQKSQLIWDLPAMEGFIFNKEVYEIEDKVFQKTINELVEVLEIKDILHVPVRKLSLGQRMKCELAAALLHQPKVLFLDEPTIGLDIVSQQKIRNFIREQNQKQGTTILLTSHYMEDVEALCKRVIIINNGKIVYDGGLSSLVEKYGTHKVLKVTFKKPIMRNDLERFGEIQEFNPMRAILKIKKEATTIAASQILNKFPVDDILIDEIEVEEVIRRIFKE